MRGGVVFALASELAVILSHGEYRITLDCDQERYTELMNRIHMFQPRHRKGHCDNRTDEAGVWELTTTLG